MVDAIKIERNIPTAVFTHDIEWHIYRGSVKNLTLLVNQLNSIVLHLVQ